MISELQSCDTNFIKCFPFFCSKSFDFDENKLEAQRKTRYNSKKSMQKNLRKPFHSLAVNGRLHPPPLQVSIDLTKGLRPLSPPDGNPDLYNPLLTRNNACFDTDIIIKTQDPCESTADKWLTLFSEQARRTLLKQSRQFYHRSILGLLW